MQSNDSHEAVLENLLRLGRRVLKRIERDKFIGGAKVWPCALLAKIMDSGASVRALIEVRATLDAKMILRSMLDALIDMARATSDVSQRRELYQQAYRIIRDDAPWIFLYNSSLFWGVGPATRPFTPSIEGLIRPR